LAEAEVIRLGEVADRLPVAREVVGARGGAVDDRADVLAGDERERALQRLAAGEREDDRHLPGALAFERDEARQRADAGGARDLGGALAERVVDEGAERSERQLLADANRAGGEAARRDEDEPVGHRMAGPAVQEIVAQHARLLYQLEA